MFWGRTFTFTCLRCNHIWGVSYFFCPKCGAYQGKAISGEIANAFGIASVFLFPLSLLAWTGWIFWLAVGCFSMMWIMHVESCTWWLDDYFREQARRGSISPRNWRAIIFGLAILVPLAIALYCAKTGAGIF